MIPVLNYVIKLYAVKAYNLDLGTMEVVSFTLLPLYP
jgi:hypothetical protein